MRKANIEHQRDEAILLRLVDGMDANIWTSPVPYSQVQIIDAQRAICDTDQFYLYSWGELR